MPPRALRLLFGLSACAALLTCSESATEPQVRIFRGRYVSALEASSFIECGGTEPWWVSFTPGFRSRMLDSAIVEASNTDPYGPLEVYVEFHGTLSAPGEYGHLGAWRRQVVVDELLALRKWPAPSCDIPLPGASAAPR